MIIETRYRDVPFQEAIKCAPRLSGVDSADWEDLRGKPVRVIVPGRPRSIGSYFECEGPFFTVDSGPFIRNGELVRYTVCPHIAEIGD